MPIDREHQWRPTALIPDRQTAVFEGRTDELDLLEDWFQDLDSRACNIYGDGGMGKTTLVLEFMARMLRNEIPAPSWRPELVCFFTAKQTRWGPNGLEVIKGIVPPLDDAVRDLVRCYESKLGQEWYSKNSTSLVDLAATHMAELGLDRDQVLLILDNTETLASTSGEEAEFARAVGNISRKLGRVLITSRRREQIEALPIRVPGLSEMEGAELLERLSAEYGAFQLNQAGGATLRRASRKLNGRPLLLDVFARLLGRFQYSIANAESAVLSLAADDLGTFLYDDGWARISHEERVTLCALGQLGDLVSGKIVEFVCLDTGVQHSAFLDTFEKVRFGNRLDYSTSYDIVFDPSGEGILGAEGGSGR